jgi:hypothetical protein
MGIFVDTLVMKPTQLWRIKVSLLFLLQLFIIMDMWYIIVINYELNIFKMHKYTSFM